MSNAQEHPVAKMIIPKELQNVENGKLKPNQLAKVKCGGQMWIKAAQAFNALYDEAVKAGHKLQNIGDYRPFEAQLSMFMSRYEDKKTKRNPEITRKYDGKTWYLKEGMSPSGTPGTSNHGLGLAIDLNMQDAKRYKWMCENAPKYGFYLQGAPTKDGKPNPEYEAWHWQYCVGDAVPPAMSGAPAPAGEVQEVPMRDKLDVGATGEDVKRLQAALKKAGFYAGEASGTYDAATGEAVRKLKGVNGLKNDTVAGEKVFAILDID